MSDVAAFVEPSRSRPQQGLETPGIDVVRPHRGSDHRVG